MTTGGVKHYLQVRRRALASGILLAGAAAGILLYLTASPPTGDLLSDQANQSKQYLREMETYGGTANVLASQIREWFDGLWQGPTLGITVACLSAVLALVVFLALTPLEGRARDGTDEDGARP